MGFVLKLTTSKKLSVNDQTKRLLARESGKDQGPQLGVSLKASEAFDLIRRVLREYGVESDYVIERIRALLKTKQVKETWENVLDAALQLMAEWSALNPDWGRIAYKLYLERIYSETGKRLVSPKGIERRLNWKGLRLLAARYLLRDQRGRIVETPDELVERVADYVALAEAASGHYRLYRRLFYDLISSLRFLPSSPTLMNAGTRFPQLAACFTVPLEDDTDSIFEAVKVSARIFKTGAGAGYDFTPLRPKGAPIRGTGGRSSGPVSFMRVFDVAADTVREGGKRRAAMMGILSDLHKDVIDFIEAKCSRRELENFNISVALHDEFMRRAVNGGDWILFNPQECPKIVGALSSELEEIASRCNPAGLVNASELLSKIAFCAWKTGDPGAVFIDRLNEHNPTPALGRIHATNPCGETPLLDWEACNLGSINLELYVDVTNRRVLWDQLARDVELAVRFLNDVIDVSRYPDKRIEEAVRRTRKIGLGVMGWADLLARLGVPYDSHDALFLADKLMELIAYHARKASTELAAEKGAYPAFPHSIHREGRFNWEPQTPVSVIYDEDKVTSEARELIADRPSLDWEQLRSEMRRGTRNAAVTAIAPTGSISIIAGVNSSIEPFFALVYVRQTELGAWLEVNKHLQEWLKEHDLLKPEVLEEIALHGGGIRWAPWAPRDLKLRLPTALEIGWEWHVRMQAAFQRWVDNAVSKTVNMPSDTTPSEVAKVFQLAWRLRCKGVTVFRDKSREHQVLSVESTIKAILEKPPELPKSKDKSHYSWLRIRKGEVIAVHEEYSGGCPSCDV